MAPKTDLKQRNKLRLKLFLKFTKLNLSSMTFYVTFYTDF